MTPALLLATALLPSHVDDLATFAANDKAIGSGSFEEKRSAVVANLGILVRVVRDARDVKAVVRSFERAAKGNDEGFPTSFGWVGGSKLTANGCTAVFVSYGPMGRVEVFRGGKAMPGPGAFRAMEQRSPRGVTFDGANLVVGSPFVRDAGMRDNTRVDFAIVGSEVKIVKTVEIEHTLEWGGVSASRGEIKLESIDSPTAFFFDNATASLKRSRSYRFVYGKVRQTESAEMEPELRAADVWLRKAQTTPSPTPEQRAARKVLPEPGMVLAIKTVSKGSELTLIMKFDDGTLAFHLHSLRAGYGVESVTASK